MTELKKFVQDAVQLSPQTTARVASAFYGSKWPTPLMLARVRRALRNHRGIIGFKRPGRNEKVWVWHILKPIPERQSVLRMHSV